MRLYRAIPAVLLLITVAGMPAAAASIGGEWLGAVVVPDNDDSAIVSGDLRRDMWTLLFEACNLYWVAAGEWGAASTMQASPLTPSEDSPYRLEAATKAPWGFVAVGFTDENKYYGFPVIIVAKEGGELTIYTLEAYTLEGLDSYWLEAFVKDVVLASDGSVWIAFDVAEVPWELQGSRGGLLLVRLDEEGLREAIFYSLPKRLYNAVLLSDEEGLKVAAQFVGDAIHVIDVAAGSIIKVTYQPANEEYESEFNLEDAANRNGFIALGLTLGVYRDEAGLAIVLKGEEPVYSALFTYSPLSTYYPADKADVTLIGVDLAGDNRLVAVIWASTISKGYLYIGLVGSQGFEKLLKYKFNIAEIYYIVDVMLLDDRVALAASINAAKKVDPEGPYVGYDYAGISLVPLSPGSPSWSPALNGYRSPLFRFNVVANPQEEPLKAEINVGEIKVERVDELQRFNVELEVNEETVAAPQLPCKLSLLPLTPADEAGKEEAVSTPTESPTTQTQTEERSPATSETPEDNEEPARNAEAPAADEGSGFQLPESTALAVAGVAVVAIIALFILLRKR